MEADIALSNLLYFAVPAIEGEVYWRGLLSSFQAMCRTRTRLFYDMFGDVLKQAKSEMVKELFAPIQTGLTFIDYSRGRNKEELDLPVTSMLSLMSRWRSATTGELSLVHDESSAMFRSRHDWNTLTSHPPVAATMNYRGSQSPVLLNATTAQASHLHRGLQLADILAGSMCKYLSRIARDKPSDDEYAAQLADVMDEVVLTDGVSEGIWPSSDVTPEELDRVGDDGALLLESIMANNHTADG